MGDFARLIRSDGALTTATLKLANSARLSPGGPVTAVQQAVIRLGMKECYNLIVATGMRKLFRSTDERVSEACQVLWRHSVLTAALCSELNLALRLNMESEEFTAGLLHDLGRILFAVCMPRRRDEIDPLDFREGDGILDRERDAVGTDHCALGGQFAAEERPARQRPGRHPVSPRP